MKAEPRDQIKRLADFLGCPFTKQEEHSGPVDKILDLCSLRNLRSLEVNKTGTINNVEHRFFSVKGKSVTRKIILHLKWRKRQT